MTALAVIFLVMAIGEALALFFVARSCTAFRKRYQKINLELIKEFNSAQVNLRRINSLLEERRPER